MPLINCEISLHLTLPKRCVISSAVGMTKLKTTDTKLEVSVVTLSTEENVELLKQLEFFNYWRSERNSFRFVKKNV